MRQIVLICHNLRSCHNVGSLLRTADGLGVDEVVLTGYTPYPATKNDDRMPHESAKIGRQIHKTALGAERTVKWSRQENIMTVVDVLKSRGFTVVALEQTDSARALDSFIPSHKVAVIVGREVEGLERQVIGACDETVMIPMLGKKESFNVAIAAGMALYALRFGLKQ